LQSPFKWVCASAGLSFVLLRVCSLFRTVVRSGHILHKAQQQLIQLTTTKYTLHNPQQFTQSERAENKQQLLSRSTFSGKKLLHVLQWNCSVCVQKAAAPQCSCSLTSFILLWILYSVVNYVCCC